MNRPAQAALSEMARMTASGDSLRRLARHRTGLRGSTSERAPRFAGGAAPHAPAGTGGGLARKALQASIRGLRPTLGPAALAAKDPAARIVALLMNRTAPILRRGTRNVARPVLGTSRFAGALKSFALATAFVALVSAGASAQDAAPDQVTVKKPRSGTTVVTGTVTSNSLEQTEIEVRGKTQELKSEQVVRIVWGAVPQAYTEGQQYFARGDFENATAKFKVAATDASAREVVQAVARLAAARSLHAWGAQDETRFREAALEAERFLQSYPEDRAVPEARMLRARATLLSGDPAAASALFRALWEETKDGPAPGYDRFQGLEAGAAAARALIASNDTLGARELYTTLETMASSMLSELGPDDPMRRIPIAVQQEAQLGEGFALLAGGQASQALGFFEGRLGSLNGHSTMSLRSGVALGYAMSLLAEGRPRDAQYYFAKVAALEPLDRDHVAAALVGMAECSIALKDTSDELKPATWLDECLRSYGDTPAAARARELKQN